jgi:hypothetical protein
MEMSPYIAGLPRLPTAPVWLPQAVSVPDDQADYTAWSGAMEGKEFRRFLPL